MVRVLVCGGREYTDSEKVYDVLGTLPKVSIVIEGGATGADCFADEWATTSGTPHLKFTADWDQYGKSAGPIRNKKMLEEGRPDLVIAFGGGKGTANMISIARKAGVEVIEYE